MKQLDMIKALAKLEGVKGHIFDGLFIRDDIDVGPLCFNPFTDLALTFKAMVKYECEICYRYKHVMVWVESTWIQASFKDESEIPHAIIECILKSQGLWV